MGPPRLLPRSLRLDSSQLSAKLLHYVNNLCPGEVHTAPAICCRRQRGEIHFHLRVKEKIKMMCKVLFIRNQGDRIDGCASHHRTRIKRRACHSLELPSMSSYRCLQ
ncbi:unnamed protein product [Pleuronectes platessa]|uniref:Uncharacterized protein n=1 Tax=Pleuronectes platessa TaxID=8262 RepID=A0A9N7VX50_PLEPL|nr:unnamed protein product [Pleuronectes platessa]